MRHVLLLFVLLAATGVPARADVPIGTSGSTRMLRNFDFEERDLGNAEDVPMHWQKLSGDNLPHYVTGRLTTDRARSGRYSFRMDLDGGSCIYRYDPTLITVLPGAQYRIAGYCQTTVMPHARARLTAYFLDADRRPLPRSIHHSEAYANPGLDEDWHPLSLELTANDSAAMYLVVQMELAQPNIYATSTLGDRSLFAQDIRGTAWFDDVTVSQVPQVTLTTDRPGNVFRRGDQARLSVLVNDRTTEDLTAQLVVTDAAGRAVYQHTGAIDLATAEPLGPGKKRLTLPLPTTGAGWYRASLLVMSRGVVVGEQTLDWVLLGDDGTVHTPDARFGWTATDRPFETWEPLVGVLPLLSAGRVKLAVWSAAGDVQQLDSARFDRVLEQLQEREVVLTACLLAPPSRLDASMNDTAWLQLLRTQDPTWRTELSYLISRHADHLDRWQIGSDTTEAFATTADLRKVYRQVYGQFSTLIDHPNLAMPCPLWYEPPADAPPALLLSVPTSILPAEIPLYLQDFRGPGTRSAPPARASTDATSGGGASVSLTLLDRAQYGREAQIADVAQRVVYALAGGAERIDLPLPLELRQQGETTVQEPTELFPVLRTLLIALANTTYRGQMPVAPRVEAFLFEKAGPPGQPAQGMVVMWNTEESNEPRTVAIALGDHPVQTDLWGNTTTLMRPTGRTDDGSEANDRAATAMVQLKVGRLPVIITGVDPAFARLRASLTIDPPMVESSLRPHVRHIRLTNAYHDVVGGQIHLRPPPGWTINPPVVPFTLNPGETLDREVGIELPYNSLAGPNTVVADVDLQADHHARFTVPLTVTVGLSDVGAQSMAFRDGPDVVIQQRITNYGDRPINYTAFATCPGHPRLERLVTDLSPGVTVVKRYRFKAVDFTTVARVRAGLKEIDGTRVLNEELTFK